VAPELAAQPDADQKARAARAEAIIASRVPDLRLALDVLAGDTELAVDDSRVGLVRHSLGGWTALATPDVEPRIGAVVALALAGSSHPRPGIAQVQLQFTWSQEVATLILTDDADVMTPLDGVSEVFSRIPSTKRMFVLAGADHLHFLDDVETTHEALRSSQLPGEAAWIPRAMRPIAELCEPERAHEFARSLTLAHLDAYLREEARHSPFSATVLSGRCVRVASTSGSCQAAGSEHELASEWRAGGLAAAARSLTWSKQRQWLRPAGGSRVITETLIRRTTCRQRRPTSML
jgi:predicted dienelactone hydrolase